MLTLMMETKTAAFLLCGTFISVHISSDIRENCKEQLTHLTGSQVGANAAICVSVLHSAQNVCIVTNKFLLVCHCVYRDFATCEVWSLCLASLWLWQADPFPGVGNPPSVN